MKYNEEKTKILGGKKVNMKNIRKIFAVLLMVAMILQVIPSSVFAVNAADMDTAGTDVVNAENGIKYVKYGEISEYRKDGKGKYTDPKEEGYVFAGWFQESNESTAVAEETVSGAAWAKFVPDDTLSVKIQVTKKMMNVTSNDKVKMRLATSVDSGRYNEVGFYVSINDGTPIQYRSNEVYKKITVASDEEDTEIVDPDKIFNAASKYFATLRISNITSEMFTNTEVNATPYWITKDGTTVMGVERTRMLVSDERMNDKDGNNDFTEAGSVYTYQKVNASTDQASYQYFQGGSDTVYLKGTYTTTGTDANRFGITIRNGGQTRQVYFDNMGVKVLAGKDTSASMTESGLPGKAADVYNKITNENGAFIWSRTGDGKYPPGGGAFKKNASAISEMLSNTTAKTHMVIWAIEQNVLYCSVDDQVVLRIPMEKMCESWKPGRYYQLGVAAYNSGTITNKLAFQADTLSFGKKAKALLIPESENMEKTDMAYEPITGSYMSATTINSGYAYGTAVNAATPIAMETDLTWQNLGSSGSRAGITVKVGKSTEQIYIVASAKGDNSYFIAKHPSHGWNGNEIIDINKFYAEAFDEKQNCNIKAAVYDGKLSILFNDEVAYECSLADLFGTSPSLEGQVSLGVATWDGVYGQAQFKNVSFYEGQEAVALKTKDWTFYPKSSEGNLTVDTKTGTASSIAERGWKTLTFSGESDVWEITGTMSHAAAAGIMNMQGFDILAGGQKLRLLGQSKAFAKIPNGNWDNTGNEIYKYNQGNNIYAFRPLDGYFNSSEAASVKFKAVIADDMFYMWLNDSFSWMIPLEETQFGGFSGGSKYSVALKFGDQAMAQTFVIDSVRTGSEVDAAQVETLKACSYFDWLGAKNMKTLSKDGKVRTINTTTKNDSHILSNTGSDSIWLSGTWELLRDGTNFFGVTLSDGTNNRQIRFQNEGVAILKDNVWSVPTECDNGKSAFVYNTAMGTNNEYVWAQYKKSDGDKNSAIATMLSGKAGDTHKIIWAVQKNTLYCSVDGTTSLILPLKKICSAWADDSTTKYKIGFSQWGPADNGDVTISDIELLFGENAQARLLSDTSAADVAEKVNMVYDPIEGVYLPKFNRNCAAIYGPASATPVIEADIYWKDMAKTSSGAGIAVKSGNNSIQIYVQGENAQVRLQKNQGWTNPVIDMKPLLKVGTVPFDKDGRCHVRAEIIDGKLYVTYNQVPALELDLSTYLDGYQAGNNVQLGVASWDAYLGLPLFDNVKWTMKMAAQDLFLRDPYVFAENGVYYLYGSRWRGRFDVFTSTDLTTWEEKEPVFVHSEDFWGAESDYWAPEVYAYTYNGEKSYYMFATFIGNGTTSSRTRGTEILKADSPLGPFKEWSVASDGELGPVTPLNMKSLDGTLYVEDGTPYMIFCREYSDANLTTTRNGEMYYIQLSQDLKKAVGNPVKMFDAKTAAKLKDGMSRYVTDGPFLYRASDQDLFLLWSTFTGDDPDDKYVEMQLRSSNGKLVGAKWEYDATLPLLYGDTSDKLDGGHGMIFKDFDGKARLILHTPNYYQSDGNASRIRLLDITHNAEKRCLESK